MDGTQHWASASLSSFWLAGSVFYLLNCKNTDCVPDDERFDCEHICYLTNWMIVTQIYGHAAYVFLFLKSYDLGTYVCSAVYLLVLCSEPLFDTDALKISTFYNDCDGNWYWWLLWCIVGATFAYLVSGREKLICEIALAVFLVALNMSVVVYFSFWAMIHVDGNILMRYISNTCTASQVLVGNELMHVLPIIINLMTLAVIESVLSTNSDEKGKGEENFDAKRSNELGFYFTLIVLGIYNVGQLILRCNNSPCSMTHIYTSKMDDYVYVFLTDGTSCGSWSVLGAFGLFVLQAAMVYAVHRFLKKILK